jgi:uncharacterized protein YbbC (DUF1343 family)
MNPWHLTAMKISHQYGSTKTSAPGDWITRPLEAVCVVVLAFVLAMGVMTPVKAQPAGQPVQTGGARLVASGFAELAGKRVGLITNQTGLVGKTHLADLLAEAPDVQLVKIYAPEHGFRGVAEAGIKVGHDVDARTGLKILSLYGKTRKPTKAMLRGIDVLVFDIQDIGTRFYTYISTMGLAMQAAAEAGISFVVLDRPNPLSGDYVSGFILEKSRKSFVGQYPIPIVHGLTVGELARMIAGESWLGDMTKLDLQVIPMQGWRRSMRWPDVDLDWHAPSPNIPTFESALVYPGIGIVGLTTLNEGRGTPTPFSLFGAPWVQKNTIASRLNALQLPGVQFAPRTYRPVAIPNVAAKPAHKDRRVNGIEIIVVDVDQYRPLEVGIHALVMMRQHARRQGRKPFFKGLPMFHAIAGTRRLYRMLRSGKNAQAIIASWSGEVRRFKKQRAKYLLY